MPRRWITSAFGIFLLITISGCSQLVESNYSTYQQAVQSEASRGDWLPAILPESASNIREAHHLETNQVWLSFEFPPEAMEAFASACTPLSYDQVELPEMSPSWWDEKALKDPWNAFYVCDDPASLGYLAILGTGEQAYFWSYR